MVVIDHEAGNWGAYCPDLPGVGVVADTREEVEQLIAEAVAFHLGGLRQAGKAIPPSAAAFIDVPAA